MPQHGIELEAAPVIAELCIDAHDPIVELLSVAHRRPHAVLSALLCSALPTTARGTGQPQKGNVGVIGGRRFVLGATLVIPPP